MAATERFIDSAVAAAPATRAEAVTPSDTVDLLSISRALWIGVTGNVKVTMRDGGDPVIFTNLTVGWHPLRVTRVWSTSTTATSIVAVS